MAVHATVRFATPPPPFPTSVSGRKVLDQQGDVFLMLTMSAWSLYDIADADITTVLEGVQAAGFNAVTVWCCGGYSINSSWNPRYDRKANGDDWWTGTAWASSFGPAWTAIDHIADETLRLELVLNLSFGAGYDVTGAGVDWEAATTGQLHTVGATVAARYPYASYPNIVWHLMLDDAQSPSSTRGLAARALFDGVNDTEGSSTRPVRWMEPAQGASANGQGWLDAADTNITVNTMYQYADNHTELVEAGYGEAGATDVPFGDCEPPYDGAPHAGATHIGIRNRVAAVYIEGGWFINWGHEDLWPFGKTGFYSESLTYLQVLTHSATLHAGYIFGLCRTYCAVTDWAPTSTFVTTGEGSGSTKAAQGFCSTAALAYFRDSRTIAVDTTILAGSGNVRLRWFDPTANTFTSIAASEAQQSGRSVTHPGNTSNSIGSSDWILVADLV